MSTQSLNQFKQAPVVGRLDLSVNPNPSTMVVRYNPGATSTLYFVPGEGVILKDLSTSDVGGVPVVDKRSGNNVGIFGTVIAATKTAKFYPGDTFEVALEGSVMYMNANAAINRGATVALVVATPGNVVTKTTEDELGQCLDHASEANKLVRIRIKPVTVST